MKTKMISFAIVLIALFSFNNAYAQNPQINTSKGDPRVTIEPGDENGTFDVCVDYAKFSGLGNATSVTASLTVEATGDVACYNDAQLRRGEEANVTPGQSLTVTSEPVTLTPRNGTLTIRGDEVCALIEGTCKNANFTSFVENLNVSRVSISLNGVSIDLTPYLVD